MKREGFSRMRQNTNIQTPVSGKCVHPQTGIRRGNISLFLVFVESCSKFVEKPAGEIIGRMIRFPVIEGKPGHLVCVVDVGNDLVMAGENLLKFIFAQEKGFMLGIREEFSEKIDRMAIGMIFFNQDA